MHKLLRRALERHYYAENVEIVSNVPLLYYVQLALIAFLLVTLVIVILFTPAGDFPIYLSITLVSLAVLCLAVYFNLGGKYKLALKMTIVLMFAGPWASVLFEYFSQSGDFIPMIYVIIPIQIAALFISTRAMFVIAAAQTIILGIMIMTNPSHSAYNWESILCYILSGFDAWHHYQLCAPKAIPKHALQQKRPG